MLDTEEIQLILELLSYEMVVEPTKAFPYRISCRRMGYSGDRQIGQLQAKLSIMLEVASKGKANEG